MLKLTNYGIMAGIGMFIGLSLLSNISFVLILTIILTFIIKSFLCQKCNKVFSLSAFLGIFPILLLFTINDCNYLKEILVGLAIACAVGRIGCYFVGCCTGKVCKSNFPFSIKYKEGSVIVDKYNKKPCSVYPTIYLEILFQALIAFLTWYLSFGIVVFGIGNASLLMLSSFWRAQPRENQYLSITSLLLFSLLSYYFCGKGKNKCCNKWNPNISNGIISIITAIITSNNIFI